MTQLRGTVKRIIFSNEESSYYIFSFEDSDDNRMKKAKGSFVLDPPYPGLDLTLHGEWEDTKYGPTFAVSSSEAGDLSSQEGIRKYLIRNVKNVGRVNAKRLVDYFGEDTLDVLSNEPERLEEVPNLNRVQRESLIEEWSTHNDYRDVAIHLMEWDLPPSAIKKAYERWESATLERVRENPYLLTEIRGVGFVLADRVALNLGIPPDSPHRIGACIKYALLNASNGAGHLYLEASEVIKEVNHLIQKNHIASFGRRLGTSDVREALIRLRDNGDIHIENGRIYLSSLHYFESKSARLLASFMGDPEWDKTDVEQFITDYEDIHHIQFSDEQRQAIELLEDNNVVLVTGLPGTGKTTVTKALVKLFKEKKVSFQLLSPTGIAAKRLSNVVGEPAATIHRTLGYRGEGQEWMYNSSNKLPVDAVIVDEFSMVDQQLMYRLLSALRDGTTLVFVGDHAQLPSVGAGNVLHELIRSGEVARANLTQIFRQEEASDIIINAHRINNGQEPVRGNPTDKNVDFRFIPTRTNKEVLDGILKVVESIQGKAGRDTTFQVLSPRWASDVGVDNLNEAIRDMLNPKTHQRQVKLKNGKVYREGDRVMVTANDYEKGVYNGEIGTVLSIDKKNKEIQVRIRDFGRSKTVPFSYNEAVDALNLAFCVTIHKCVHPDTLVETDKGLQKISDISGAGMIATPDGMEEYHGKVENPENDAIKVSTKAGFGLTVTPEHGLDVWDREAGEYVRKEAVDLGEGEFLRFRLGATYDPSEYPELPTVGVGDVREKVYDTPTHLTPDVAEFFGLMVGDGCNFERGFRVAKRHPSVVDRFSTLCENLFGYTAKRSSGGGAQMAEVCSTYLSRWVTSVGSMEAHSKKVPPVVLKAPLECQKAFLRGLFEDGSVHLKDDRFDHIQLSQKNSDMLDTVQTMLLRMGIIAHRKNYSMPSLYLYTDGAKTFAREIGFISDFKAQRMASSSIGSTRGHVVPLSREEVRSLWSGYSESFPNQYTYQNAMSRGYLSRTTVSKIVGNIQDNGETIPDWLESRLQWHHDRITTLEHTRCRSMCVEVPSGHRFLQNGCSGWNSQGSEWDYIIMPFVESFYIQLQRNLLYTAVTRAKKKVFIFGQWSAMQKAVSNDEVARRNTVLAERLSECLHS